MMISEVSNNNKKIIKWEKQGTKRHATIYLEICLSIHTYMHIHHSGKKIKGLLIVFTPEVIEILSLSFLTVRVVYIS